MPEIVGKKRPTVAMIAQNAGVSRAAVYAVLNSDNASNISLSEATRTKIKKTIQELKYIPNNQARSLVSGRSMVIGLLLVHPTASLDNRLASSFFATFGAHRYQVLVDYHHGESQIEREKLKGFLAQNVDALIISQTSPDANLDLLEKFIDYNSKVIIMGGEALYEQFSYVAFDEIALMELVADHLTQNGCHQIAYLAQCSQQWSVEVRQHNFEAALARDHRTLAYSARIKNFEDICTTVKTWFATQDDAPDAIVCFNDRLASVLIHALYRNGITVPEQVRVIGIDNDNDPFDPLPLTTVELPFDRFAQACWNAFAPAPGVKQPHCEIIPCRLLCRESSPMEEGQKA